MKIMKRMMMVFFAILLCTSLVFFACGGGNSKEDDENEGDDGTTTTDPGDLPEESWWASWNWAISDDSEPNEEVTLPLPKPPYLGTWSGSGEPGPAYAATETFGQGNWGGISTISGTEDEEDPSILKPTEVTVVGPDGETEVTAFQFTGIVQVIKDNRAADEGARYPMVGWEAVPDEETLVALQGAVSYSFYIKVVSAAIKRNPTATAVNKWVIKTAVGAEGFANQQGHEFKTYFGNSAPAGAGAKAQPSSYKSLAIGQWHKITVYLDPTVTTGPTAFNMDQDSHIPAYNRRFAAAFDPTTATKIQWQISLQDQDGIDQRGGVPYDIPRGEMAYDVLFYGLELQMPE